MKKLLSILLVTVFLCMTLTACGNTLSGTYAVSGDLFGIASSNISYTFDGSNVTLTSTTGIAGFEKSASYTGTYEIIKGDTATVISFAFTDENASFYNGQYSFSETETGIVIDGVEYVKQQ